MRHGAECLSEQPHHIEVARGDALLRSLREQEVADEHRQCISDAGIQRGRAVARVGLVDDVVVHQTRSVQQLDTHRHMVDGVRT